MASRPERRKQPRMVLNVPVRVQGHEAGGKPWEEMTASLETSFGGIAFRLKRVVEPGQVVQLSLPLPKTFRQYDLIDPSYRVCALVRDVVASLDDFRVGVVFLGKTPPKGYEDNPGGRYLLPSDPPPKAPEARHEPRHQVFLNVWIKRSLPGAPVQQEPTVTENVGKHGACVPTTLPIGKGEILVFRVPGAGFETRAEVRNVTIGKDNVPRLNLLFLDSELPDRLMA